MTAEEQQRLVPTIRPIEKPGCVVPECVYLQPCPRHPTQRSDAVDHPEHYNAHPSGVECIDVVEHMGFNLGNAIKYVWRADLKGDAVEDLRKARWYLDREIGRRESATGKGRQT